RVARDRLPQRRHRHLLPRAQVPRRGRQRLRLDRAVLRLATPARRGNDSAGEPAVAERDQAARLTLDGGADLTSCGTPMVERTANPVLRRPTNYSPPARPCSPPTNQRA